MIFPDQGPPRVHVQGDDASVVYKLYASTPLPVIDCSMSLKTALFSKKWLKRYNTFQRTTKRIFRISFAISLVLTCTFVFLDRSIGQWVTLAASILLFFPVMTAYLILRIDLIKLLAKTYEFWYITIVSIVSNTLVCLGLRDARASLHICLTVTYLYVTLMDANNRDPASAILGSVVGAVALGMFLTCVGLRLIKDYEDGQLIEYGKWTLTSSDVIVNGLSTVLLVILRNAYRKRQALTAMNNESTTVRCITYRTRVKFVEESSATVVATVTRSVTATHTSRLRSTTSTMSQMRLVPLNFQISACDFVQTSLPLPSGSSSPSINRLWTLMAITGITATAGSIAWQPRDLRVAALSLACSAMYCTRTFMFHNRRLMHHMKWSFDFLFLSVQSWLAHIVLCHLLHWEVRICLLVLSNWFWMYWVLTLDLLTPLVRRRLGITMRLAYVVLVLQLLAHVLVTVDILRSHTLKIDDRMLFHTRFISQHGRDVYAVPFLLNRMVTTFCWCGRLLWRLHVRGDNDLLMVYGAVEYDDFDAYRRRRDADQQQGAVAVGKQQRGP